MHLITFRQRLSADVRSSTRFTRRPISDVQFPILPVTYGSDLCGTFSAAALSSCVAAIDADGHPSPCRLFVGATAGDAGIFGVRRQPPVSVSPLICRTLITPLARLRVEMKTLLPRSEENVEPAQLLLTPRAPPLPLPPLPSLLNKPLTEASYDIRDVIK